MRRLQKTILLVLLFGLSACTYQPVFTLEVVTPMPTVSTSSFVDVTEAPPVFLTPTAFALPSLTPPPLVSPTDFSPILYGGKLYQSNFFFLLGGVSRDGWLVPDESVSRFSGEATYSFNTMETASKYFAWGKSPQFSPTCGAYSIATEADFVESNLVAVLDGWVVTKRATVQIAGDDAVYQQAVADWLQAQGMSAPQVGNLQIFRVDLEGDGVDEVFISATHLDESQRTTSAGDYSIVLMRKMVGGAVETKLLVGDLYTSQNAGMTFPRAFSIDNFIDLNQDGILEVVVGYLKWEGVGASIFQVDGLNFIEALRAGC